MPKAEGEALQLEEGGLLLPWGGGAERPANLEGSAQRVGLALLTLARVLE